jgi:C4-dicarboxylate transporter, DctM subunit
VRAAGKAIIPGITPAIIVTGIVGGVFTPTEAGAIAVVYAAFIGTFIYRELDLKGLLAAAVHTAVITGLVMFLIFTSFAFSWVITLERVPEAFASYLLGSTNSAVFVFLLMNLFLLAIGTFLDPTPTILITVPIFLPIAMQYGIDPTHFAIVFTINMAIAQVSPPAGTVLFTACGIARVSMAQVTPPLLPLMGVLLLSLVTFVFMPSLVLLLPNLLFK